MSTVILTDLSKNIAADHASVQSPGGVSATLRTLHGGRRNGVQLLELSDGHLSVAIIPTRGMGLWKAKMDDIAIGWASPVQDGPVHPTFVNQAAMGGLGWLQGFDEMMVRCGLTQNGPPSPVGDPFAVGLHGMIANRPAHFLAVHELPDRLTVEGHVDEACLFGMNLRMITKITLVKGSRRIEVEDEIVNMGNVTADLELLYHWNFGRPFLEGGATFTAAAEAVCPRDATSAGGIRGYDVFDEPTVGYPEQVFFFKLIGDPETSKTAVMLADSAGTKGLALRFDTRQLPCFSLWKNTGGYDDGYVTGLEPATNYPNPKPFEKEQGRVISLPHDGRHLAVTTLEVLPDKGDVDRVRNEIDRLKGDVKPTLHHTPVAPFAMG
jgi:hypothetical protein